MAAHRPDTRTAQGQPEDGAAGGFAGFPTAAFDFYDDLEADNSKVFWQAHRAVYDDAVRAPMSALVAGLAAEFGTARLFRPYRDVRFSHDKTPYKTQQGAFVAVAPSAGWYLEISAAGFRVAAGFYRSSAEGIAAIRTAIDGPQGAPLERVLGALRRRHWAIEGERVKTAPRGYPVDHPRIELLRHKTLTAVKQYGFDPVVSTRELLGAVRADWRELRPLVNWVAARLEGTAEPGRRN